MPAPTYQEKKELQQQFILFRVMSMIVDTIAWAFFSILVFKEAGGYLPIFLAFIMLYIGCFISFSIYSFLIDRLGYLNSFKVSMVINAIVAALFAFTMSKFSEIYLILSFLRGIALGTFWPICHLYLVKEVHNSERSSVISLLESIILLLQVFLPALAGSLISYTGNYEATFYLSAIIYIFGCLYPFTFNKKSTSRIHSSEITRILKKPYIGRFLSLTFLNMAVNTIMAILMTILPFVFIKSEFGVGILASIVGIFAAILSFYQRNKRQKTKEALGLLTWVGYTVMTIVLSILWTTPILIARSLFLPFTIALGDTSKTYLDTTIREKILGDFRDESTLEMNMIIETVFLFARISAILVVYFLINAFSEYTDLILRITIAVSATLLCIVYMLYRWFNDNLKIV